MLLLFNLDGICFDDGLCQFLLPLPLVSVSSHVWCDACETPENREASLQGERKRNYPSSSSCLRKHKTVILRFCCRSKHPSSRFQSQAINKMGKPKRGKECREEEERSGHGWGGSQSNEYLQLCLVYKCEICVGVKKRRGCHPSPAKTGE